MKKLLLILLLCFSLFISIASPSLAQTTAPVHPTIPSTETPSPAQDAQKGQAYPLNTNPDVKQDFHTYTQTVFIEILASAVCIVSGVDVLSADGRCLGVDTQTKKLGYVDSTQSAGLAGIMGNMIASTYQMPASSGMYVRYLASNFGVTQTSYAQFGTGIGFEGLEPILDIWKVFRNLTYLAFVLAFVLIGLGIMFRLNIDARAVMTVQNQLPKIILALVLITLSYAIAGFLIDMMYLSIYLIVNLFASNGLATVNNMSNPLVAVGSIGGVSDIAHPAAENIVSVLASIFDGAFGNNIGKIVTHIVSTFLGAGAGAGIGGLLGGIAGSFLGPGGAAAGANAGKLLGGVVGTAVGIAKGPDIIRFAAGIIVYLILVIAIFSALFRVWFNLIKAYIFILLDVIFAPFFILGGILPGSPGGGFGSWIRSMLGNLAAFPTVLTLFLIGAAIQSKLEDGDSVNNFIPPLVGSLSDDSARSIGSLIGLGIILIMPEAVNITKSMIKSPDRKLASAVWQPIGTGQNVMNKFVGNPLSKAWRKENDGTRGFLRAGVEDALGKGAKKIGLTKLPPVKAYQKWQEDNRRRRREHMYGTPSENSTTSEGNDSTSTAPNTPRSRRRWYAPRTWRRQNNQPQTGQPQTREPSDEEVNAEARARAIQEGLNPDNDVSPQTQQRLNQLRAEARRDLSQRATAPSSPIATGPRPESETGGGRGSGGSGGGEGSAYEGAYEGAQDALRNQPGPQPPTTQDPTASAREAAERRTRDDEENRRGGNSGGFPNGGNTS